MTTIFDLPMEPQVNQPLIPTEKAQIVFTCKTCNGIIRFNNTKKAEKAYKALLKAWDNWHINLHGAAKGERKRTFDIPGDMYIATIDLSELVIASYVDIAKRQKFVPWQG